MVKVAPAEGLVASREQLPTLLQMHGILVRSLEAEGYALDELLRDTSIAPARYSEMTEPAPWRDFQQLIRNALRLTRNPALGLWFGRRVRLSSLGVTGLALLSSPSLMDAISVMVRYSSLHAGHFRATIEPVTLVSRLGQPYQVPSVRLDEDRPHDDIAVFLMESTIRFCADVAQTLWGSRVEGLHFEVIYDEPAHWQSVAFEYPVLFSRPAYRGYIANPEALVAPLFNGDTRSLRSLEPLLERGLQRRTEGSSTLARARAAIRLICSTGRGDLPRAKDMEGLLGCSSSELRNALAAADLDYRQLMNQVRRQLAEELLMQTGLPVPDIAMRLGYRDTANFRRAFRSWTGLSPSAFRSEMREEASPAPQMPQGRRAP